MEIEVRNNLENNGRVWHKKGNPYYWHREDGPAVIYNNGHESWWYYNIGYYPSSRMPLILSLNYCKWEYRKKHGN